VRGLRLQLLFMAIVLVVAQACASASPGRVESPGSPKDWRGFNLLGFFNKDASPGAYEESDFAWIHELGFNFIRLPLDYRFFTKSLDPMTLDQMALSGIDQAVEWGGRYSIHVSLNLHRAPGYCVNRIESLPATLWTDAAMQSRFVEMWGLLGARYRGIGSDQLSFNLVNEPGDVPPDVYVSLMGRTIAAIRQQSPQRMILVDGLKWGSIPTTNLAGPGIVLCTRGYYPFT
jgi:endoglucanase